MEFSQDDLSGMPSKSPDCQSPLRITSGINLWSGDVSPNRSVSGSRGLFLVEVQGYSCNHIQVEARKLEYDCPLIPKPSEEGGPA